MNTGRGPGPADRDLTVEHSTGRAPGDGAAVLRGIYDPLCGWCYAAAPLLEAARGLRGLALQLHGGGMLAGDNRRLITPQWRDHVMPHDRRIAQLTGQPFSDAYFEGLLRENGGILDSAPPITAVLAAEQTAGRGLDLLLRLQRAHYVEGRRISDDTVLRELAVDIGLPATDFAQASEALAGPATQAHIVTSRQLLAHVGGHGFPTFILAHGTGRLERLDIEAWLGRPRDAWRAHLKALIDS